MKLKKSGIVAISVSAVILAVVLVLNIVIGVMSDQIDRFVIGYKTGEVDSAARAEGAALVQQIQEEGTVLVQNNDSTLPLNRNDVWNVNVFGWASVDWVYSGSGSGRVKGSDDGSLEGHAELYDLYDALDASYIEYNTELRDMYKNFQERRDHADDFDKVDQDGSQKKGSLHSFNYEFSRLYEPDINDRNYYSQALLSNALDYSSIALVVLGRVTGESNDCPKVQYKRTTKNGSIQIDEKKTYLEISDEERGLLEYVGENFETVIVLINSTNVMELGFLEEIEGLDACLIVGTTGTAGALAIPSLLFGEKTVEIYEQDEDGNIVYDENDQPIVYDWETVYVSPSGRTADTYAYDLSTSSTYVNTGSGVMGTTRYDWENTTNFYTNGTANLYPRTVKHTNGSSDVNYYGVAYTDYAESIYMGYKWYETADAEGFWNLPAVQQRWNIRGYDDVVQYPFGFGLSYTTFSWEVLPVEIGSNLTAKDEISVQVVVTNTGNHPGQDVVQLYYTPPYEKKANALEKSAVNLLAFGKTQQVLQPGESETVVLTFKVEDMKSYDCYNLLGTGAGYVLERGEYVLSLRTDAHTVATDRMTRSSDATIKLNIDETIHIGTDSESGGEVKNRFTGSDVTDGVAIDGVHADGTKDIVYLSRYDFAGTFPYERKADRAMSDEIKNLNLYNSTLAAAWDAAHAVDTDITTGAGSSSILYDDAKHELTSLGYDLGNPDNFDNDALWDGVLNAMSFAEMSKLVLHGYVHTEKVSSIGYPGTTDLDGPNQISSYENATKIGATGFSSIVLAQSWNLELSYSMALTLGREAAMNGIGGWYGPGINVHRSPFGGRNYEYYSEDAYLSGMMSAYAVAAAKNAGVFSYLKHLCLYESESGRDGMYNWLTEQALREVYIKPFELSVKTHEIKDANGNVVRKVGGCTGIMSSYGRIGAVWTGGSEALLTEVVRDEWGFKGAILTDYADHHDFMNGDQMVRAGGDLWMDGWLNNGEFKMNQTSYAFRHAVRNASKHIIYMWANARATNMDYNEADDGVAINPKPAELNFRWYIPVLVGVDVIAIAGCGLWIFMALRKKKAPKGE